MEEIKDQKDQNQQILTLSIFEVCGNTPIYHDEASEEENKQLINEYEQHEYGEQLIKYLKEFETCWKTENRILSCTLSQIIKNWSCLMWLDETNNQENNFEQVWKKCATNNIQLYKWLILFYKKNDDIKNKLFEWSCKKGYLEVAKWLYSLGNVNIHINNNQAFILSCVFGHLEVAKWLYSLSGIDIHFDNNTLFKTSCGRGQLEIAQWLYSLNPSSIDIHAFNDETFVSSCEQGHLEVAQWLYSLGGINIHANVNIINGDSVFVRSCKKGHLEVAKWLYSLGGINITQINAAFVWSCINGQLEVAKWLHSLDPSGINSYVSDRYIYVEGPPIIINWLSTL